MENETTVEHIDERLNVVQYVIDLERNEIQRLERDYDNIMMAIVGRRERIQTLNAELDSLRQRKSTLLGKPPF